MATVITISEQGLITVTVTDAHGNVHATHRHDALHSDLSRLLAAITAHQDKTTAEVAKLEEKIDALSRKLLHVPDRIVVRFGAPEPE